MDNFILSLDQGTTSSKAIIFDRFGKSISIAQKEFKQIYPHPGWVEHDAKEIWSSQAAVITESLIKANINDKNIAAIGVTNQRETTLLWDKNTGEPIYNAIVWQDHRTSDYCDILKKQHWINKIREKTGLIIDSYFSATKIKWLLDHIPGAREKAQSDTLAFGTIDSWLIWNLTNKQVHVTDITNASRTMLFNINTLFWDEELLELFNIPKSILPEVKSSSEFYGVTNISILPHRVPITGIAGDQHAALFGQMCTEVGMVKNTYGTGCFMLMNIGNKPILSKNNLLTTIAWKIKDEIQYALEGSVFIGGAVIQWLKDGLHILSKSSESEKFANSVPDTQGVYLVPAFSGLGAPYWDQYARGTIVGITCRTTAAHLTRAALESIAFQSMDVMQAMEIDSGISIEELRVDGGGSNNKLLLQFQADILDTKVIRPKYLETTALGAAYLAGLAIGYWSSIEEIKSQWGIGHIFNPKKMPNRVQRLRAWSTAVKATQSWSYYTKKII